MKKRILFTVATAAAISIMSFVSAQAASPLLSTSHLSVKDSYIKDVPLGSKGTQLKTNLVTGATGAVTTAVLKSGDSVSTTAGNYTVIIDGDVNGDGAVTTADYITIKSTFAGTKTLSGWALEAADVSRDGKLSTIDYMKIRQYFAGFRDLYSEMDILPVSSDEYTGPFSADTGLYGGIDDLGRELFYDTQTTSGKTSREVGVFYFLAQGNHGPYSYVYDNNLIVQKDPNAPYSEGAWIAAGGGPAQYQHFWGKPIYGYYRSADVWVMRKQIELLTATGIDYIVIDATNGFTYDSQALHLMSILKEYYDKGWDVPKIAYYTNTDSESTVEHIYSEVYQAHPEYRDVWYKVSGKPLIIGNTSNAAIKSFFTIKAPQWPNQSKVSNGFPWMEFSRWNTTSSVYNLTSTTKMMSVSPAQHNVTCLMSAAAWYGAGDRVRSYGYSAAGLTKEQGMLQGINYKNGWDYAISQNVDNVFITGYNEWVAGRQPASGGQAIRFVDCADPDASRDIEPMDGILKDNYLMQTANYVRKFKKAENRVSVGKKKTIYIDDDFSQWDEVTTVYKDFTGDTEIRAATSFGGAISNSSGRNDLSILKVCHDNNNVYFYAEAVEAYKNLVEKSPLYLFIRSKGTSTNRAASWEGYDYMVAIPAITSTEVQLKKSTGGWNWNDAGEIKVRIEGNKAMIVIPKSLLGISKTELLDIQFKWNDGKFRFNGDFMQLYSQGDSAPYGRYNYVFSQVKK